ncbi:MAG TPA: hypothetical protein VEF06_11485 [Bryobacteraceae bacterium]|nr:hypothetical protein [Bryobacteraceae bacterium]
MLKYLAFAFVIGAGLPLFGQSLPIEPPHESGASITGAFEGWYKNADGSFSMLLGYYNRNTKQVVEIPAGPDNRIEPGGPDRGQPTTFLPGRQWGMFTVKVPADFGTGKLTWTIVANGQPMTIPISLHPDYEVSPFGDVVGNLPPSLSFAENGPFTTGPAGLVTSLSAKVGQPLPLRVWVADDLRIPSGSSGAVSKAKEAHPVTVTWGKYRGPGAVTFQDPAPAVEKLQSNDPKLPFRGVASTEAVFAAPGEYSLHVYANDYSGEGGAGFECCWTFGDVKVSVAK